MIDGEVVASVERKSLDNLVKGLVEGTMQYQLADLATLPHAAVVIEDRYSQVFKVERVQPGWLAELLAQVQVRFANVPIVFCETRQLAEEWTYRFLGAALANALAQPDDPTAPRDP
jgi:ERCC4-type nuclease